MSGRWIYRLYGQIFSVPFRCAQLAELPADEAPDIVVETGPVPRGLENPTWEMENMQAAPGFYLQRGGMRAGHFLVETGGRVTLERNPHGEDEVLAAYFLSHVIAAVMRAQGRIVLHGSTVVVEGKGLVLAGPSGAGKSTTQAALLARGGTMVSDDVTVVCQGAAGQVEALPGIARMNLCEDAAGAFGRDFAVLPRSPLRRIKVMAPHHGPMAESPTVLHRLYRLEPAAVDRIRLLPRRGGDKFAALLSCVYGPMHPSEHVRQFSLFAAMCEQLEVFTLERPRQGWSLDEVTRRILDG